MLPWRLLFCLAGLFILALRVVDWRLGDELSLHDQPKQAEAPVPAVPPDGEFAAKPEKNHFKPPEPAVGSATNRNRAPEPTPVPPELKGGTVQYVMQKDGNGNIFGFGAINGRQVRFLADTGANVVVVPEKLALGLGLSKGAPIAFKTGGGVIVHHATSLDSLSLGQIEMHHIPAAINPAMQDEIVLLGMSALGLMDMHMVQGNLVLTYKAPITEIANQPAIRDEPFKRSSKDCAVQGNKFDQKALDCLRGK